MKQEQFNSMIKHLKDEIVKCKELTSKFIGQESVSKWSVDEYINNRNTARELEGRQDQILQAELYHVIGMGNLSGSQNNQFAKLIKELSATRPVLKTLASLPEITLPGMPSESNYKCSNLGIKLKGGK